MEKGKEIWIYVVGKREKEVKFNEDEKEDVKKDERGMVVERGRVIERVNIKNQKNVGLRGMSYVIEEV
jgi:hypothetical protein